MGIIFLVLITTFIEVQSRTLNQILRAHIYLLMDEYMDNEELYIV